MKPKTNKALISVQKILSAMETEHALLLDGVKEFLDVQFQQLTRSLICA